MPLAVLPTGYAAVSEVVQAVTPLSGRDGRRLAGRRHRSPARSAAWGGRYAADGGPSLAVLTVPVLARALPRLTSGPGSLDRRPPPRRPVRSRRARRGGAARHRRRTGRPGAHGHRGGEGGHRGGRPRPSGDGRRGRWLVGARGWPAPRWSSTSPADVVMDNIRFCIDQDIHCVVGTTGFDEERLATVAGLAGAEAGRRRGHRPELRHRRDPAHAVRPGGGVVFPSVEVVELHHPGKADAPTGTAGRTAGPVAAARRGAAYRRPRTRRRSRPGAVAPS